MSVLEYGVSIVSIILGLAVAHLLNGITSPLRLSRTFPVPWIFLGWCLSMILVVLGGWFGAWTILREVEVLAFPSFLLLVADVCVLYCAARVLVPDFTGGSLPDLHAHFERVRTPFFICIAVVFGFGSLAGLVGNFSGDFPVAEAALGSVLAVLAVSGAVISSPRFQNALAVVWPMVYVLQQITQPAITAL